MGQDAYIQYATELGLNVDSFKTCISENRYADAIDADVQFAVSIGVQSTPSFFINGIPLIGAQPYQKFQQVIDAELAAAGQK